MSARRSLFTALALLAMATPARADAPEYVATWGALLDAHTNSVPTTVGTTVDYAALKGPAAPRWKLLLQQLASAPAPGNGNQEFALWINAYNILAIDTVVRNYPVDSIRDIGSLFRPVWKHEAGKVAGRTVSLHEIEHEILRKLGDPRIHAAIVCASTSCPSLRRTPFTTGELDSQLDEAMTRWLRSEAKGLRIDRPARRITVSKIFDWFEEDFAATGGVRATVTRYAPTADREWLAKNGADARLDHFDYDWSLNRSR